MSIDLTNSDKLDTTPLVDRYSNVLAKGVPTTRPTLVKRIIPRTAIQQAPKNISRVAPAPVVTTAPVVAVAPVVTPPVVVLPTPAPSAPSPSGGGGGGGAPSGDESPTDKSADTAPTANVGVVAQSDKDFYMKMWFWGLLVGGVAGYLYAKNKGKDLKTFALIGAGIGGFAGLVVEKTINKGVNPNATNVTVVTAVPSVSGQAEQQQEQQQEQQEQQQQQ